MPIRAMTLKKNGQRESKVFFLKDMRRLTRHLDEYEFLSICYPVSEYQSKNYIAIEMSNFAEELKTQKVDRYDKDFCTSMHTIVTSDRRKFTNFANTLIECINRINDQFTYEYNDVISVYTMRILNDCFLTKDGNFVTK